jgi:CPA2 family monovalent cation:H+ antiporter-2
VAYSHLWLNKKYSRGPLISLELLRIALGLFFIGFLMSSFFTTATAISLALLLTLVVMIVFGQRVQKFYERVESRFLFNLNAREAAQKQLQVLPWDSHLLELHVSPNSPLVGKTLVELAVRERFGVNIALIERGNQAIPTPKRDEHLYPYDKVMIIGSDEQLASIKPLFEVDEETEKMEHSFPKNDMSLQKVVVNSKSVLYQQSIRESNIREATQGLVVGIERDGKRILNPDSDLVFENDDIVWVVGNKRKIVELLG